MIKEYTLDTIGGRIRASRIALGMTQEQLAEGLYVKPETISYYENDKVDIKTSIVLQLAKILEVKVEYLLEGTVSGLTAGEAELLATYRSLKPEVRTVARNQLEVLKQLNQ